MKDEEKLPSRKRANTSLEKEKREKQKFSKMKKSVMEKTIQKQNKKLLSLKAGILVQTRGTGTRITTFSRPDTLTRRRPHRDG